MPRGLHPWGVHFTILPASPRTADFYEIWHTKSTHRRNHVCQIFSRSVQGLRSSDTPKIAISHWLAASPLRQCTHCRATLWLVIHSNHGPVSYHFRDKRRFRSKIANVTHSVYLTLSEFPLEFCNGGSGSGQKTRVMPSDANKTKTKVIRPRPPEANKGTWRISLLNKWTPLLISTVGPIVIFKHRIQKL